MTKLTLSNFPKLKHLILTGNELTEVVLSGMPELVTLNLERNSLTNLNGITTPENTFPKLTALNLRENNLQGELDLSKITANLKENANGVQILRAGNNSGVVRIKVKDQDTANALNTNDAGAGKYQVDGSGGSNPEVPIRDSRLRLLTLEKLQSIMTSQEFRGRFPGGKNDTTGKIYKSDLDRADFPTALELDGSVRDLSGLEFFSKVKKLTIYTSTPTTLNLTGMDSLEEIISTGSTIEVIQGNAPRLKKIILRNSHRVKKINVVNSSNIEQITIEEDSNIPNHIECIAVPADRVDTVKQNINLGNSPAKTTAYRSKVQSSPCN